MWACIPTRGYAVIFRPDNNPGEKDRWHLKEFTKYRHRIDQFTDIDKIYQMVQSHKCFFEMITFPQVPQDIYDRYLEVRQQRTFKDIGEKFVMQKDLGKIMAYNIKYKWNILIEAVNKSRTKLPTY